MCPLDIHLHSPHQFSFVCWQMSTLKLHTFRPCPMPCLKQFERTSLHTREGQSFKGQVAWQVPTLFPGSLQCKEPHLAATDFDMPKCKDVRPARYLAIWRQSRHPLQGNANDKLMDLGCERWCQKKEQVSLLHSLYPPRHFGVISRLKFGSHAG